MNLIEFSSNPTLLNRDKIKKNIGDCLEFPCSRLS